MTNDPISDMLTRLRNALMAKEAEVSLPFSKIKMAMAEILEKEGYVSGVEKEAGGFDEIKIKLKYIDGQPAISSLKRISTPGRHFYVGKEKLPLVRNNLGIAIISTSQGLMTNREARKKKIGGEVLAEIY